MVVVFSSMTLSDILAEGQKRGVGILKDYLEYAETGKLSLGSPSGRAPDSDFEIHVANRLTQLGYEVDAQVGSAGWFSNPDGEMQKLEKYISRLKSSA